jgi:hypothetical protein
VGVTAIEADAWSRRRCNERCWRQIRYTPILTFTTKEIRNRWSNAVIQAMREAHPEAFE